MKITSPISIILIIFFLVNNSFATPPKDNNPTAEVFALMKKKQWQKSYDLAVKIGNHDLKKIVLSQKYLDPSCAQTKCEDIIKFLQQNPNWPQKQLLKIRVENCINNDTNKQLIVRWFIDNPPLTSRGYRYYALAAHTMINDPEELQKIIKSGWYNGSFATQDQEVYLQKFKKYLTRENHIKKIDNHLLKTEITKAKHLFYLVDTNYKRSFNAQIALIQQKENAKSLFKKIPKQYYTPGLIYHYLNYCKNTPTSGDEIASLINLIKNDQDYADKFSKLQSYIAREFIEKKKYSDAYKVISCNFSTNPENKSNAEFLSGWLALRFLHKPKLALKHFNEFDRSVTTPMSKSRGLYWLARSHEADNDNENATKLYQLVASKYPYTFYGQMALVEMKQTKLKLTDDVNLKEYAESAAAYAKSNDVIRATKLVSKYGSNTLSQIYIQSIISQASDPKDVLYIAHNIHQMKNVHHSAWAAKYAMQKHVFIKNYACPTPYKITNTLPIELPVMYSIIRQESVFDQHAVSNREAMGLMQLIEATSCDVAKKISTHCSVHKLTKDPVYNITIGSHYLEEVIRDYDGSYILAMAAYNAGPHRVKKWLKLYGDPRKMKNTRAVLDWIEIIPFYETRNYVQRVLENLQIYRTIVNKNDDFHLKDDLLRVKK
jgi:soluble lytic murein transglycosylase